MEWEIKRERKRKKDRWNLERLYSLSKKEEERDGISLVRPYFVFVQMYSLSTHRYRSEAPATEVGPNPNSPPPSSLTIDYHFISIRSTLDSSVEW